MAWPLALNGLLMQSMLMIDTLLVSPLGEVSLAAMGIATTILAFILAIQMALANGSQLVLSRAVGSGIKSSVSKAFVSALLINCSVASLFWVLLTLFDQPLITALSDDPLLVENIATYLSISKYLVLFTAVTQVMIALFNSMGKSKISFRGYLVELPVNTLVSYVCIYGLSFNGSEWLTGMGVQGAAVGSVFAIGVRLLLFAFLLRLGGDIDLAQVRQEKAMTRNTVQHFKEIFPVATNVTILMIGATVYQLLYSQLDIHAYVAISLMAPWIRSGTQFIGAWSQSSAITVSQAIGSGKLDDLANNVKTSITIAIGISVIIAVAFLGLSLVIDNIYPDLEQSTYQALVVIAPLYILLPIVRGYNTVHGNVLRALGKTTAVFKINFIGQWVISIPLCVAIVVYLDNGFFWAFAVQPFEEFIRAFPLRNLSKRTLASFDQEQAKHLMYD
ncbi:MATE family efflux transporter [Vibrio sp. WXL103]|uniref:MATE family efflux transporter n=1 Tax=Vibrio sp. WXL103 TaxID=3450710 RepID=UPI003EC8F423